MMMKNIQNHLRFLELYTVGALAGLMIAFGTPEDTWAAEQQTAVETIAEEDAGTESGTELTEKGPGIGIAPEGTGSGGYWTSSARLERIMGPGEDPEHPRFYKIINGKIVEIIVR